MTRRINADWNHLLWERNGLFRQAITFVGALLALMVCTAGVLAADVEPSQPDLSDEQWDQLHRGEVVIDVDQNGSKTTGRLVALIQDPINDVVPFVARCWEYSTWRENVVDTVLQERIDDSTMVCSGTTETPFPARDRHGHFRVQYETTDVDGKRSFAFVYEYLEGTGNLDEVYGFWLLTPYGEDRQHTLAKHSFNVDVGSRIPGFLIRWATNRDLPKLVYEIRKRLGDHRTEEPYWDEHNGE